MSVPFGAGGSSRGPDYTRALFFRRFKVWMDWTWSFRSVDSAGFRGKGLRPFAGIREEIRKTFDVREFPVINFCDTNNNGFQFGGYLYRLVREHRPRVVLEVGVQRGCSTFAILSGLHDNGYGELHSIDIIPDLFSGRLVAPVVPRHLKDRWRYHEGNSLRILPKLLRELGTVDMLFHDADHTLEGQFGEIQQTWDHGAKIMVVDHDDPLKWEYYATNIQPRPSTILQGVFFR